MKIMNIQTAMSDILNKQFNPLFLDIINESHLHKVNQKDPQTHFRVTLVSRIFIDMSLVKRHRLVYDALEICFKSGLHALSLKLYTPTQWTQIEDNSGSSSPKCRGGFDKA